jgi:predicted nucleic acid-binding protein
VEGEAILAILEMAERGELSVVVSEIVAIEVGRTPDDLRRQQLEDVATLATDVVPLTNEVHNRGAELQRRGFKLFDALHLAAAESAGIDCLCTGDDRLRKRAARQRDLKVRVVSILELLQELES